MRALQTGKNHDLMVSRRQFLLDRRCRSALLRERGRGHPDREQSDSSTSLYSMSARMVSGVSASLNRIGAKIWQEMSVPGPLGAQAVIVASSNPSAVSAINLFKLLLRHFCLGAILASLDKPPTREPVRDRRDGGRDGPGQIKQGRQHYGSLTRSPPGS